MVPSGLFKKTNSKETPFGDRREGAYNIGHTPSGIVKYSGEPLRAWSRPRIDAKKIKKNGEAPEGEVAEGAPIKNNLF